MKEMELEELQQHIEADQQIDHECQRLQAQVRDAQQLQEEASRTQELITRQLERQRQRKKSVHELELAKMVTSLLKENSQDPGGTRPPPCPSDHSKASNSVHPLPMTPAQPQAIFDLTPALNPSPLPLLRSLLLLFLPHLSF